MENEHHSTAIRHGQRGRTLVFNKFVAVVGIIAGVALSLGTPFLFGQLHSDYGAFVESLPEWALPTLMIIAVGGGVLIVLICALFGLLIPSRITPPHQTGDFPDSTSS